ncbi:linoleate 9S-lipoxygenase 6 isoform X1 [Ananas comosus]|uniref:Lipoxygenase n=1 Tax=Ananas comosus TaxID=4615 RepID=A0A6P5GHX5_ANACO|nr:linoleate 9S-lipoxygenase 6 isoform X1 [Ananas comosus]
MQNLGNIVDSIIGGVKGTVPVKGTVVLMRKNVLDFNDFGASVIDNISELLGQKVSLQLVSATVGDPNNENRGVVGQAAYLENYINLLPSLAAGESKYNVTFQWDAKTGIPGAVIVKNHHTSQFYLKTLTIDDFPGKGRIVFVCNSWVYPADKYSYDRVFFANNTYFRANTPAPLLPYRDDELYHLKGDDVTGQLQEWDRVYNYAYYNDLGNPDRSPALARPVLGGSAEYPYPRRGKTGRPPTKTDPNSESRLPLLSLDIYVPRDERFGHLKMADFLTYALKAVAQSILPLLESISNATPFEFDSFDDVLKLYDGGIPVPKIPLFDELRQKIPFEMLKELLRTEGNQQLLKLPKPQVIQADEWAWRTDEEFTREMLAGVNPLIINRLDVFPPVSKLDPSKYGNQNSTITAAHIQNNLDGSTIDQALKDNRLFILDHHDTLIPYLNRINSTGNKIYASRTLLFLKEDSTLKPLAIELSLPSPDGEQHGAVSNVYTPSENGVEGAIWQLAKAYATVNDSGVHQLISHWLNTHATMEPFVIATNRQLSALHPINKLLSPHYRDTMNINALARQILINAGGILELTVFPARYAMEMSSFVYKSWNFMEEALPADLIKRGILVGDGEHPDKQQLLIKDYPYAVDGLAIWHAIETWVSDYCSIYYPSDAAVQADAELQAWWKEVREVGHGDKKDEPWWPQMQAVSELTHACTTIIWVASALHAAVNFGQYPYAGYMPNGPTISRRFMPAPGTVEYDELKTNPDKAFVRTTTGMLQTILVLSLIEILSTHTSDEKYLGQRDTPEWTTDQSALRAFERFNAALAQIEADIVKRNRDPSLKNRNGPVKMPYTLLYRTSEAGITAKGIPNSVSI